MEIQQFIQVMTEYNFNFYVGIPDSQLKCLCDYLYLNFHLGENHFVVNNEGGAVGLAAGYHLATGKLPCVYMQNSGIGNAANPIISLLSPKVYAIPVLFIIGWRGEPGIKDEPQHIYQGEITLTQLQNLGVSYAVLDENTNVGDLIEILNDFEKKFKQGNSCAFVIKNNFFSNNIKAIYKNVNLISREKAIELIVKNIGEKDYIVSTTGKTSRELFEIREKLGEKHDRDFLTVGSMGHSSMIALGISLQKAQDIWCIDGDGALIMHMGALSITGKYAKNNYRYILINNGSHETVGGLPTVADNINFELLAKSCGYENYYYATCECDLVKILDTVNTARKKCFIEIKTNLESRKNLGRPTLTPIENKNNLMKNLKG